VFFFQFQFFVRQRNNSFNQRRVNIIQAKFCSIILKTFKLIDVTLIPQHSRPGWIHRSDINR